MEMSTGHESLEDQMTLQSASDKELDLNAAMGRNEATSAMHNNYTGSCNASPSFDSSLSFGAGVEPNFSILLATAQIYAKPKCGNKVVVRCLIDNGSQNHLISVECCKALGLPIIPLSNSFVKGIGSSSRPILGYVNIDIESRIYPKNKYSIYALVVDCITDQLPTQYISNKDMSYLNGIPLADLTWNIPGNVDMVLGAQLFPYIYFGKMIKSGTSAPPALSTAFGYILMGDHPYTNIVNTSSSFKAITLNDQVQKFWQLEEIPNMKFLSPEETDCENLYVSSVKRSDDGRYSVALPFCKHPNELGNSRATALRRFLALERKFKQTPDLQENYNKVIDEYIQQGYLSEVAESDVTDDGYYIPHHAVIRPDKPMPRIVLDASAQTHTGVSLNDILHAGPNLQADLFLLLLNFRLFPVAMTADIKQMYLQIEVPTEHRKYLRILFRFSNSDVIRTYQFNRVPFGLKSSPYLAMRTVRQLAQDMRPTYPDAATVAESKLYMDDLVYSIADEPSAVRLSRELISLFKAGDFDLVKWTSNSQVVLESLPDSHRNSVDFSVDSNNVSKVLGLSWEPADDSFFFTTSDVKEKCTKRNILSIVARLFDVLGLVAPTILYAKLLIKELWLSNIGWDDVPPENVIQRFSALIQEFPLITTLRIPRHVGVVQNSTVLVVGFCDASMNGYGTVIYLHTTDPTGNITVRLLCAKSKVSPTKVTTLARLELCAAVMMSNPTNTAVIPEQKINVLMTKVQCEPPILMKNVCSIVDVLWFCARTPLMLEFVLIYDAWRLLESRANCWKVTLDLQVCSFGPDCTSTVPGVSKSGSANSNPVVNPRTVGGNLT
ncbi:pao retrotransposon peptidase domain-containing protein [Phthorimaea operculella]|nr:pao retrotransposon peptidase domain-containing protein [Phthorimaea operculella]